MARARAAVAAVAFAAVAFAGLAFPVVAAAGCHAPPAGGLAIAPSFAKISADNQELRDAFNGDAGKVRVVMLVSPS